MEKIIGFVGYECEDIAIYLARIMSEFGKRVAIIDRTEHGMLMEFFDMHQNQGQLVSE